MDALPAPRTLPEFRTAFPDEAACVEYLYLARWGNGFVCPKCGDTHPTILTTRALVECRNGHQTSVTAGTLFHGTKTPLTTWFQAFYLVSTLTPGISALQFQRQLGIKRYETAFQLLHKIRSALVAPARERLKGEVEIDEAFVGGVESGVPGRGAETKALVVVAVEIIRWTETDEKKQGQRGHERATMPDGPPEIVELPEGKKGAKRKRAGRVRMTVIPNASAEVLIPWVQANVEPGSTVVTDGWPSYNALASLGYAHKRVLQSKKGKATGEYLPMVHLMISNLKRWLTGTHKGAVQSHHLQAYLNEFTFRFNRRFWRGPAFSRGLDLAAHATERPEYDTLYSGEWRHPNPKVVIHTLAVAGVFEALLREAPVDLQPWVATRRQEIEATIREGMEKSAGYRMERRHAV